MKEIYIDLCREFLTLESGNTAQDCEKLGGGLGTRQRICFSAQVSRVIKTRTFLRGLDEVCQLLHGVGQLLYEVHLLSASGGVACRYKISCNV